MGLDQPKATTEVSKCCGVEQEYQGKFRDGHHYNPECGNCHWDAVWVKPEEYSKGTDSKS